jgi:hypothetical protein
MDRVALAVWGSGEDDVFVVGGGLGNQGAGALVLHWDGSAWTELPTGRSETLWWVWGASPDDVWMVGEDGLILRWDGAGFTVVPSPVDATLFGVWGASPDDVWIVGGTPNAGISEANDVVLRWGGAAVERVDLPAPRGTALFKVWGADAGDLWMVGEAGTIWRRSDGVFVDRSDDLATPASLFTVHGCARDEVYAVGGQSVFAFDGASWARVDEAQAWAGANGVACAPDGVLVVGLSGLKLRLDRASGAWIDEQLVPPYATDFHGSWISPEGAQWAVGGDFLSPPGAARKGTIATRSCAPPSAVTR